MTQWLTTIGYQLNRCVPSDGRNRHDTWSRDGSLVWTDITHGVVMVRNKPNQPRRWLPLTAVYMPDDAISGLWASCWSRKMFYRLQSGSRWCELAKCKVRHQSPLSAIGQERVRDACFAPCMPSILPLINGSDHTLVIIIVLFASMWDKHSSTMFLRLKPINKGIGIG